MSYQPISIVPMNGIEWFMVRGIMPTAYDRYMAWIDEAMQRNERKFLPLWINSDGGDFHALHSIREYILDLKKQGIPVVTFCGNYWGAQSAGLSIYAMGDLRYATPATHWLMHTVSCHYNPSLERKHNVITDIATPEPAEEVLYENVKEMTDMLFSWLGEDLGVGKDEIYKFLEEQSDGTNETTFGIEQAKKLNLYTHLEFPRKETILKEIENINKN